MNKEKMHKLSVVSVVVFLDEEEKKEMQYDAEDMANWYIQIRRFPEVLFFGKGKNRISAEGQAGKLVSTVAKEAEDKMIEKIGKNHYFYLLNELLHPEENEGLKYENIVEE